MLRIVLAAALSLLLFAASACQPVPERPADETYLEARHQEEAGQYKKALALYRVAAENDHGPAQYRLAGYHVLGALSKYQHSVDPTAIDRETAHRWFQRAARSLRRLAGQGDAEAQFMLGHLYFSGEGVELDREVAQGLWESAARQNYAEAYYLLGVTAIVNDSYTARPPQAEDYAYARSMLRRAADLGYVDAFDMLATLYMRDENDRMDGRMDMIRAVETYHEGIARGSKACIYELDAMLKALRKTATAGNEEAYGYLADLFEEGLIPELGVEARPHAD